MEFSLCKDDFLSDAADRANKKRILVPGARIELATPAFSGRRSTTELPRHVWFRNCMGCGAIVSIRSANAIYCEEESSKSAKLRGQDAPHQSEEKSRMAASSPHFWY
jgi:hypothetical protein